MADLIKKIKIKKQDGTFTDYIPIGAEAQNISTNDGDSVQLKLNKKPYYYNSVADMKADTKLKTGDMAITLGYYSANDDGGAEYLITNTSIGTHHYEELENGKFAELIIENEINPLQLGAKCELNTDDSEILNKCLNMLSNKYCSILNLNGKHYYISNPLKLNSMNKVIIKNGYIDANNNFILDNVEPLNNFLIYSTDIGQSAELGYKLVDVTFDNLVLNANSLNNLGCMYLRTYLRVNIFNCEFNYYKTFGFKDSELDTQDGHEIIMDNCKFINSSSNDYGIAMELNKPDSIFSNIIIRGGQGGILLNTIGKAPFNEFSNVHIYGCDEYAIEINQQANLVFNQIYFDGCGLHIINPWLMTFTNCMWLGTNFTPIKLENTSGTRTIAGLKFIGCNAKLSGDESIDLFNIIGNFTKSTLSKNQNIFDISGSGFELNIPLNLVNNQKYNMTGNETFDLINGTIYNISNDYSNYNNVKLDSDTNNHINLDSNNNIITKNSYYDYKTYVDTIIVNNYNSQGYTWLGLPITLDKNTNYRCFENYNNDNQGFKIIGFNSLDVGTQGTVLKPESTNKIVEFNSGDYEFYIISKYSRATKNIVINKSNF